MKKIVMFAVIGTTMSLVCSVFWLSLYVGTSNVVSEELRQVVDIMEMVSLVAPVVSCVANLTFFVALYIRQK